MADIYAFPTGATSKRERSDMPARPAGVPDQVWAAVESVRAMEHVPDVRYREIPVPSTLADFGIGVELECGARDEGDRPFSGDAFRDGEGPRVATGWIMILHALEERLDWDGRWRCVCFARMPLESGENDGLTPGMYWDGMCDYLTGLEPDTLGGTVTVTRNTSFGAMSGPGESGCEMRVSFTPQEMPLEALGGAPGIEAGAQVACWARFLRSSVRFGEGDALD